MNFQNCSMKRKLNNVMVPEENSSLNSKQKVNNVAHDFSFKLKRGIYHL